MPTISAEKFYDRIEYWFSGGGLKEETMLEPDKDGNFTLPVGTGYTLTVKGFVGYNLAAQGTSDPFDVAVGGSFT